MRKTLAFVLTAAAAMLLLGGCGEETESEATDSPTAITAITVEPSQPVSTDNGEIPEMDYATASRIGLLTSIYYSEDGRGFLRTDDDLAETDLSGMADTVESSDAVTSITAYTADNLNGISANNSFTLSFMMATENDILADEIANSGVEQADELIEKYCTWNSMDAIVVDTTITVVVVVPGNIDYYVNLKDGVFSVERNYETNNPVFTEEPSPSTEVSEEPAASTSAEPAASESAQPSASESEAPAATDGNGYTYKDTTGVMYTTADVNVRNEPDIDGERLGTLDQGEKVTVTGICNETGWYRITYNGSVGYVSNDYLTSEN
ncbi:MAG: SH3 domain-containing protein [Oscillospiraceae bacterium]|nr:SH3 domain-containing protein [Oscillospiraceae bacterium]